MKCQVTLASTASSIGPDGGPGDVTVTTTPECPWDVSTGVNWVSGLSPTAGQGSGTVAFQVAPNPLPSAREGDIVVNDNRLRVSQQAAPCQFALQPVSLAVDATGAARQVAVSASSGCAWTTATDASWITFTTPVAGNGDGTVGLSIAPNPGDAPRVGAIVVAGQRVTITQAGADAAVVPCTYAVSLTTDVSIAAAGGSGSVAVTTSPGCAWTASSSVPWIAVASGANGSGNGAVTFNVATNPGSARAGTIAIAGQTFTVTQAAAAIPCSYTIGAPDASTPAAGGTGSVAVTAAGGCAWTASSSVPWVTVTSGASGTGNGAVAFSVAPNQGTARTGILTVAGQTFMVTQAAAPVPCTYAIASPDASVVAAGGTGTVAVTTSTGCTWTASSNAAWITVTSGASGTGDGSVAFSVAANPGSARSGTLTVAGHTFTVNQAAAPVPCMYTIAPADASMAAAGGTGTVAVTTSTGCTWTASSNAAWITVTSGASGNGGGSVAFNVAPNPGGARTGTIAIAGQTFTVNQAAAPACTYTIAPPDASIAAAGGTGTVAVTTTASCGWTASSNAAWITVTSGASGSGNGSVAFSVAANPGTARTGTITIAGQTFTVNQAATAPCTYTINPPSASIPVIGGTGTVTVSAAAGCNWTAISNANWITVTSGASGTANGSVGFSVAANLGSARTGTITIAGQTFTVTQAALVCSYSINPTSVTMSDNPGNSTVAVSAGPGCSWTASSNAGWITVLSGTSGTGNGTVTFRTTKNHDDDDRFGTLTIAGHTFTVRQRGD